MEQSSANGLPRFSHQSAGRVAAEIWMPGDGAGFAGGANIDQLLGLLLEKVDERHAQYQRECNDRFVRVEIAQQDLTERVSAVRLQDASWRKLFCRCHC